MKTLLITITLMLSISCLFAQKETGKSKLFVRVYDLEGKKISKGIVLKITDTTLEIEKNYGSLTIDVGRIGSVKTKRSAGYNILMGSVITASTFALVGALSARPGFMGYTSGEGATGGFVLGLPLGATIGAFTCLFKQSRFYSINGDVTNWKAFKQNHEGMTK